MAHDYWVKIGGRIVADIAEFAQRRGSRQVVFLEMFVPTDDLLEARTKTVEVGGLDGSRTPCRVEAFRAGKPDEAEVLLEYLVPLSN